MSAPFITVACIPMRQCAPMRHPCTTAPWPMLTPGPMTTSSPGPVCTTAPSCTLLPAPTVMRPVSARSTAPYHTLASCSSRTAPASTLPGATNAAPASSGTAVPMRRSSGGFSVFIAIASCNSIILHLTAAANDRRDFPEKPL